MEIISQRLSRGTIVGYGVASVADAACYNFVFMYFLFFLTNVAGLNAALAGTIYSIAVIYDALTNPVIGQISDNTRSKYGRRRPYLLASAIPLGLTVWLMFTAISANDTSKFIFYLVVMMCFWTSYSVFYIPYTALGAEVTLDYDERTRLRTPATMFNLLGNVVGMSAPMFLITLFMNRGLSAEGSWRNLALIIGAVSCVSILITWKSTKGKELPAEETSMTKGENAFKVYWKVLKLKPYKYILGIVIFFIFGYAMISSSMVYYVIYCAGMTENDMSTALLIYICAGVVIIPVLMLISEKIGKKNTLAAGFVFSAAGLIVFRLTGIDSLLMLVLCLIVYCIGNGSYWLLIPAMVYDITEVYEYKYQERREAAVTALAVFIVKIASAIGIQVVAVILTLIGYNAELQQQSDTTISGISNIFLVFPSIALIVAAVFAFFYPLSKERFDKLSVVLESRRNGRDVSAEGLEKII